MAKNIFWNHEEGRLRALWRQIIQFLLLSIFVVALVYILPYGLFFLLLGLNIVLHSLFHISGSALFRLFELPQAALISASAAILSVWMSTRVFNRERLSLFGFRFRKVWWTDFFVGCVLGVVLNASVFLVEWLFGWVSIKHLFFNGVAEIPFAVVLCVGFVNFLLIALFEETSARGYPLRNFAQGLSGTPLGPRKAMLLCWLLTSFVFGFGHYSNPHATLLELLSISTAGLLFGLGYLFTGDLGLSLGLHTAWDFTQGNIFGFSVAGQSLSGSASFFSLRQGGPELWTGGVIGPDGGLLSICAFLLGVIALVCYIRWRYGKVAFSTSLTHFQRREPKKTGTRIGLSIVPDEDDVSETHSPS